MNSNYSSLRPPALKRKRSVTQDLDEEDFCDGNSKSWDDPTVLEELGLGMLGSDASSSDDGGLEDIIDCTSSDSNELTENVDQECCQKRKKQRLNSFQREPFKEQVLVENETNIVHSEDDGNKIEKLKPSNCVIKNSQVSYGRDENANRETTDTVCNNVFSLCRLKKEEKPTGKDYFKMLPDELILSILKCLDRRSVVNCCLVSRRMNRIAADDKLWMRADLSGRNLPKLTLGHMMRRGPLIIRLASASIPDPVCDPRQFPENFSCKIQYLDLSMAAISQEGLAKFLGYCTKLKKLSVENCSIGDKAAKCIAQNKGLEVLNMAMCSDVTAKGLNQILTNCTRLQSFNIAWTGLTRAEVKVVSTKLPLTLERLNISGCRTNITDEDVIAILQRCTKLVALDVSDSDLTEDTINYISSKISGLESLSISRCYSIPLSCLRKLNKVDSLQYLDVFGQFSDFELSQLKAALDKIEVNQFMFSSVARPTVGFRRTSIWGLPTRD